jgi:3-methylcrotonyl-CoA carboxylase alpha subunit
VLDLPGGALAVRGTRDAGGRIAADLGGARGEATVVRRGSDLTVLDQGRAHLLALFDPLVEAAGSEAGAGRLTAPMPGKIVAVRVKAGEAVKRGQALVTLEAMKMEHTIAAPADGVVAAVRFQPGEQVEEGAELVALEEG